MSKPNKKHNEWCKNYKSRGQREINKVIKQERHKKRMAMFAKRRDEGKGYEYEPNPYDKTNMEHAHNFVKDQRETKAFGSYKNSMPEFQRMARVFGRLDRDMRAIEEATRQEEIRQKRSNKKKSDVIDN